jgi:serine protease Do
MKGAPLLIAAFGLVAAACGSSTTTETEPTAAAAESTTTPPPVDPTTTSSPEATTTTVDPGPSAAGSIEEVRAGVVRIVGTGTFVDPAGGVQANVPGSGSGFVIDPAGIAVTNNHVVTGAGLLEVYVAGEEAPRNARVLGVSECSDLAVIQIDGAALPFLDWYDGPVTAGMGIFAAGFPLGDTEYTVLDGIVSKENASGETSWASVDSVIEHSADTLPGNSGGPIVTADGTVLAVNYAGNNVGQSFAIGIDVARPVVDRLTAGEDVNSIGINGEAMIEGDFSGIWVYSVESGSPADTAGIEPGDLLLSMESIVLATDGTMADYCDILRSHLRPTR